MIFNNRKRKQAVIDFFEYVESELLINEEDSEVINEIKKQLKSGFELIENNECGIAFENLASELVEHYIIIDRKGTEIVKKVIKLCKLDKKCEFDLRRINSLGYKIGSWKLTDSEKLAKENKYTFYKPSKEITKNLEVGNIAKLTFEFESSNSEHPGAERMWVEITEINNNKFKGNLDNHPFYIHELYAGDEITFEHKHIIDHDLELSEPNLVDKYYDRCFATNKVLYENSPINYIYREEPMEVDKERGYIDTGWRFLSGNESDEYIEDFENISLVSIGSILSRDDSFIDLLEAEIGTSFERNENGIFERINE
ncbi:immunity protein Imm33 domain-containing protein [Wenyingzhuangia marina]|uniref:DUF2185 domain-containing protein n=1 Tax=Wenyingzhuangia marina TaxID=1195760 RepID=A0A1M5U5D1_9FLAO|nr:DUF2185 domain-containing protein [Wenyingzhuangia marina]GGF69588.1 hypothetical protein GCM10011397_10670 [Wenyingzhuangia marina]SHH57903.1 hypothetical protein SAMN05444281_1030 [Wenyingzhuangia marina]